MPVDNETQICRLAIRHEGKFINAYIAMQTTMSNALRLGGIDYNLAKAQPKTFEAWKDLMRMAIQQWVLGITGAKVRFDGETNAPEHERADHD